MRLLQLQYFQAVCQRGGVSRAAEYLSISQPAISAAIRALEQEFGVSLFSRSGRRLALTKEGKKLLELSNHLLRQAEETEQIMRDLVSRRNRVRLGITPMQASIFLSQLFAVFSSRHPEVDFQVEEEGTDILFERMDQGSLDMCIISHIGPPKEDYHCMPITRLEYCACLPPGHPLARQRRVAVCDISEDPLVLFAKGYQQNELVKDMYAQYGAVPNVVYRSEQLSTIWELVANRGLVTFLYYPLSRLRPDLRFIPLDPPLLVEISLFWRKGGFLYSDMDRLIQCVRDITF